MENLLYNMGFTSQWFQIVWVGLTFIMLLSSCYLIGLLSEKSFQLYLSNNGLTKYFSRIITGWVVELVVFQVICIPMVIADVKFSTFSCVYVVVIGVVSAISLILFRKVIFEEIQDWKTCRDRILNVEKNTKIYILIGLILVLIQFFMCIFYMQVSEDSIFDYAISAQTLNNNSMFRTNAYTGFACGLEQYVNRFINSWYMYRPFLALVFQMHPTIVGKILIVPMLLVLSYICYYFVAKMLINDREKEAIFMIFLCLINMFGDLKITSMNMLLIDTDNGKAVFSNLWLPLLFCCFIKLYENYRDNKNFVFIMLLNICSVAMSPTALIYSAFTVMIALGIIAVRNRELKVILKGGITILPNVVYFSLYMIQERWGIWQ